MGRVERLGAVRRNSGPVTPVVPVHRRTRQERLEDEEADREQARREHDEPPPRPPGAVDVGGHVDVRA